MKSDPAVYGDCMAEIKWRMEALDKIILQEKEQFLQTEIEYAALQLRMIFELIALSSIAANKGAFETFKREYLTSWRLKDIIKAVKSLNANYYPRPIRPEIGERNGKEMIIDYPAEDNFLTESELKEFHGKCHEILHAWNPYKGKQNLNGQMADFRNWRNKIVKLLAIHKVQLYNENQMIRVIMNDINANGKVSWAFCEAIEKIS